MTPILSGSVSAAPLESATLPPYATLGGAQAGSPRGAQLGAVILDIREAAQHTAPISSVTRAWERPAFMSGDVGQA